MANEVITQEVLIRFKADVEGFKNRLKGVEDKLDKTAKAAGKTTKETNEMLTSFQTVGRIGSALPGKLGPIAGSVGALTTAFKGAGASFAAFGIAATGVIGAIVKFGPVVVDWLSGIGKAEDATKKWRDELTALRIEEGKLIDKTRELMDSLFPEKARGQRLVADADAIYAQAKARIEFLQRQVELEAAAAGGGDIDKRLEALHEFERRVTQERDDALAALFIREQDIADERRQRLAKEDADRADARRKQIEEFEEAARERAEAARKRADEERKRATDAIMRQLGAARIMQEMARLARSYVTPFGQAPPGPVGGHREASVRISAASIGADRLGDRGVAQGTWMQGDPVSAMAAARAGAEALLADQEAERVAAGLRNIGTAADRVAAAFSTMGDAWTDAFEAWGAGQESLAAAMGKFIRQGIADVLRTEAKKHVALAAADAVTLNFGGAALHLAAASGLAAAAGKIGGGGGAGSVTGGGRLPGAAAGAFGGGGGSDQRSETIIIGTIDDNPRRIRRGIRDMLDRADAESGPGLTIVRA